MWSNFRAGLQGTLAASNAGHYWCVLEFELGQLLGGFTKAGVWQKAEPVKGVCTSCAVLRPAITSAFTCCTSCSSVCDGLCSLNTTCSFMVLTQPSWLCLVLSKCWRRDGGVLKGDGSICTSFYCFPNIWVLIPSVVRNSFPLNGFYYATHVWGGFLSQNSSWLHKKAVSSFAGWFGSPLMGLILSVLVEGPWTENLGNSVAKSCFKYYKLNSVKYRLSFDCVLQLICTWCFD